MSMKRSFAAASYFVLAFTSVLSAELIGVGEVLRFPVIVFDGRGTSSYNAVTDVFLVDADPIAVKFAPEEEPRPVGPTGQPLNEEVSIRLTVNDEGLLSGGVPGDDLVVIGEVDADGDGTVDYAGVLLTGEITDFGFDTIGDGGLRGGKRFSVPARLFDFKFSLTGGSMAPLFTDGFIGVVLTSEDSTFDSDFSVDFDGRAKGNIGFVALRCDDPGEECDDGLFCNGTESCVNGVCQPGESPCDDEIPCTIDSCDEGTDTCDHVCLTPAITCPTELTFECDAIGPFGDPVIDDDCSVNPTFTCTEMSQPGKLPQEEMITRTCTVTNDCGNSDSCVQQINIVDTTPPTATCPPDLTFECDDIGDFGGPTDISDNCAESTNITVETETIIGDCTAGGRGISPPPIETRINTYKVSDGAATSRTGNTGNTVTCVQRVDIIDTTPPVLLSCPLGIEACAGEPLVFELPACMDACTDCEVTCIRTDGLPLNAAPGADPFSIVCTGTDECGNDSSACEIPVGVVDCSIPAVSTWGLIILALLILVGAKIKFAQGDLHTG